MGEEEVAQLAMEKKNKQTKEHGDREDASERKLYRGRKACPNLYADSNESVLKKFLIRIKLSQQMF